MCHYLKGDYLPYQLSFNGGLAHIVRLLVGLPYSSPGAVPRQLKYFYSMAESLILEPRRGRNFPRTASQDHKGMLEIKMPLTLSERH